MCKLSGILSILAGILYILIQIIHPDETLEMVNSQQFFIVGVLTMIMAIFSIIGLLELTYYKSKRQST
ncbi:MAG: hypothetical protein GX778_02640 [Erysipelothrix sp.]|nr:hypothetical protein [Erysipelothrix sp.]